MTKTGRRILAVVLFIVTVLLIGCLIFTGNRLANFPMDLDDYEQAVFGGADDTLLAFTDSGAWYYSADGDGVVLLETMKYEEGIIIMQNNGIEYRFVALDRDTVYDESANKLLTRRVEGG